ncbi:hypothetical protein AV530_016962 [Patagioenas fasciata monilis]|uniref:Uncharacterized protein n=1 Tax=Patagioenas fasciata monilis TaxID=372326 RepID=A0A1V4J4G7_PATFA|nr:hypothetical protein AV530_016962 [Patagioenas fasciata monilis]
MECVFFYNSQQAVIGLQDSLCQVLSLEKKQTSFQETNTLNIFHVILFCFNLGVTSIVFLCPKNNAHPERNIMSYSSVILNEFLYPVLAYNPLYKCFVLIKYPMGESLHHDKFNSKIKMSDLSKGMSLKPLIADSQKNEGKKYCYFKDFIKLNKWTTNTHLKRKPMKGKTDKYPSW